MAGRSQEGLHNPLLFKDNYEITEDMLIAGSLEPVEGGQRMRVKFQIPKNLIINNLSSRVASKFSVYFALRAVDESNNTGEISNIAWVHVGFVKPVFDQIIIGTNSRPFETVITQTHVQIPDPVLFYHNRILMQKLKNSTWIRIPKELGRNTKFTITSDDLDFLDLYLTSPNGTTYSKQSKNYDFYSNEMVAVFSIELAQAGFYLFYVLTLLYLKAACNNFCMQNYHNAYDFFGSKIKIRNHIVL